MHLVLPYGPQVLNHEELDNTLSSGSNSGQLTPAAIVLSLSDGSSLYSHAAQRGGNTLVLAFNNISLKVSYLFQ